MTTRPAAPHPVALEKRSNARAAPIRTCSSRRRFPTALTHHATWMLLGYGLRLSLQAAALLLLARVLGPADFGVFIAAFAIGAVLAPLVELGAYGLIVRDDVIGHSLRRAAGQSLIVIAALLPVGLVAVGLGQAFLEVPIPVPVLLTIAGGAALSASVSNISRAVHVATKLFRRYAIIEVLSGGLLCIWVLVLVWLGAGIDTWTALFFAHCLLVSAIALAAFAIRWGVPIWETTRLVVRVKAGAQFAVGGTAQLGLAEIDKTILAHSASLDAAGIYGAVQRIVHVAFVPLIAVFGTTYRRFFESGREGLGAAVSVAGRLTPWVLAYGVAAAAVLWLSAPWIAGLLGPGFEQSTSALRLLAPLIIILGLQSPFADALTGSDLQGLRTAAQVGGLGVNVLLNLWLVPAHGWYGSVLSAWVTHVLLLMFFVGVALGRKSFVPFPSGREA